MNELNHRVAASEMWSTKRWSQLAHVGLDLQNSKCYDKGASRALVVAFRILQNESNAAELGPPFGGGISEAAARWSSSFIGRTLIGRGLEVLIIISPTSATSEGVLTEEPTGLQ